ncbi:germin subfamily 1 member 13 [Olea europaea subsp. europaea]|uniref:Germin subfamily 1 member 13 n=1 Tax=Olea europaea subsp. europaea TaxID=158383 RepID=A0A8S0QRP3_OLEEU|nr:germin subfamily 1 member 13 [Olea europaea subsp. europaea]
MVVRFLISVLIISLVSFTYATDPSPLQDFCVSVKDAKAKVFVNGKICKDSNMVSANDSSFLDSTCLEIHQIPSDKRSRLNTLGISLVRIDFAPYGLNPPHTHPQATEVLVVVEEGLIHFHFNVGKNNAVVFASLSSQNLGVITIANADFGSDPPINPNVLTKVF